MKLLFLSHQEWQWNINEHHPFKFKDAFPIQLSLSDLSGVIPFPWPDLHYSFLPGGLQTSMVPLAYGGVGRADYERDLSQPGPGASGTH